MQPINLADYAALAQARLEPTTWDYFQGGSDDEQTLHANRSAFSQLRLRPRVLVDVRTTDLRTTVLGTPVRWPILVAPTGYHGLAHQAAEVATAQGTSAAGTLLVVSTMSNLPLETIAAAADGPRWFQLYLFRDRAVSAALVRRVEAAGYRALVLTVDAPRLGHRERDLRNSFSLPAHLRLANFVAEHRVGQAATGTSAIAAHADTAFDQSLNWSDLAWLREQTTLPIVLKGILTAEDALQAVEHGVAGIIVSNHGGRQLDSTPATIEVLPEIVAAVGGRCEIYLDGGVRRGTDVLKALALGAHAVLLGRPILWGLAVDGAAGVQHVLELLAAELELAMVLAGRPTLASFDRSLVATRII